MQPLKELEIGVVFWAVVDRLQDDVRQLKDVGVRCGQIGVHGSVDLKRAQAWKAVLEAEQFIITALFCAYDGESYQDYSIIQRTVGFVPRDTRRGRLTRTLEVSDLAADLGISCIACHLGFLPEDPQDSDYAAVCDMVMQICDHVAGKGQTLALETGQERADVLLRFVTDCARENLKINFDPANMILYGTQEPLPALRALAPLVVSAHCKDGTWPVAPRTLGTEMPLGKGDVDVPGFISVLRDIGYRGPLHIEREAPDPEERLSDVRMAVGLLRQLLG